MLFLVGTALKYDDDFLKTSPYFQQYTNLASSFSDSIIDDNK